MIILLLFVLVEMAPEFSSAVDDLIATVSDWPEVETAPHRFEAIEFDLAAHEVGHIHQGGTLDINFPKRMRDALLEEGRAEEHHYVPQSSWVAYPMRSAEDIDGGRWLLRVSYLYRALTQRKKDTGRTVLNAVDLGDELNELAVSESVRDVFENVTEIESTGSSQEDRPAGD